jgi:hypothetical protein
VGRLWSQLAPRRSASEIAGVAVDAVQSRRELIIENAVLRHQVNVLRRRSKRPKLHLGTGGSFSSARACCRRGVARSPSSSRRPFALASYRLPPVLAAAISASEDVATAT